MEYYPSMRYHKTEKPKLVKNSKEDQALGKGWEDTPAKFKDEAPPEPEIVESTTKEEPKKKEVKRWRG